MNILILNPGSTSLKFRLFDFSAPGDSPRTLAKGKIERIGSPANPFSFSAEKDGASWKREGDLDAADYRKAVMSVLDFLCAPGPEGARALARLDDLSAVGFKAVHAGALGRGPGATYLTDDVLKAMERYTVLAAAHNPPYLTAIRLMGELAPNVPRAALFEPAFHAAIPEERTTYGLPLEWRDKWGIQRYGFHGASHHYISRRIPELMDLDAAGRASLRLISCHLGGSSSLCAIQGGRSADTTMGFSPQTGLPHSARCETIDPFVVIFAQKEMGLSADEVAKTLCEGSGLKGLSGGSGDFRDLWTQAAGADPAAARRARLALEVFFYQVRREIAAMTASLEGVDAIAFTGGIGENGVKERAEICGKLEWLGVRLDPAANDSARGQECLVSAKDSKVAVWTCPTNEELVVAREIGRLLNS